MKRSLLPYCLLATLLVTTTLVSAQNLNPLFRHLPPNAERIYHLNLPALTSKISWQDIVSNIPPPKSGADQSMMDILRDPSLAGVDIQQDIFIAQQGGNNKYDSATFITLLVHLTDSGKFVALIREKEKSLRTLIPGKGRVIGNDKVAIAYDDKLAVVTIITPAGKEAAASLQKDKPGQKKTGPTPSVAAHTLAAARKSAAALQGFASSIYTSDPVFIAGFSDDADFHMWSPSGEGANKLMDVVKKKAMPNRSIAMNPRGAKLRSLTALRFDAGKITMRTTAVVPPDSAKNYRILDSRPLNVDLINRLPGKAILGMLNLHFDPTLLPEFVTRLGLRKTLDSSLSSKGLTIDDVTKAFKGDILLAGMQPARLPDTGKINPNIYFVTTIGDPNAFMKIAGKLNLGSESGGGMFGKMKGTYTLKDNILVIGKTKELTESYFSNTTAAGNGGDLINERVRTNLLSVVVDVKAIIAFMQAIYPNPTPKTQQLLHFLSVLDRLTFTAGGWQNGQMESYFELKMADASENSLRSIFKLLH